MKKMEQLEMESYQREIAADMARLVEKYRRIFEWDIPDIDQSTADKLIVAAMQTALERTAGKLD